MANWIINYMFFTCTMHINLNTDIKISNHCHTWVAHVLVENDIYVCYVNYICLSGMPL